MSTAKSERISAEEFCDKLITEVCKLLDGALDAKLRQSSQFAIAKLYSRLEAARALRGGPIEALLFFCTETAGEAIKELTLAALRDPALKTAKISDVAALLGEAPQFAAG